MTKLPKLFGIDLSGRLIPADVVNALAIREFLEGSQPWSRTLRLQRVRRRASLLPRGHKLVRSAKSRSSTTRLVEGDGWTLLVRRWGNQAELVVTAQDAATGQAVLKQAADGACEPPAEDHSSVPFGFWHLAPYGATRDERSIRVEPWSALRRNYAAPVALAFDGLTSLSPDRLAGKLLLLHGPPGTGKTTALRSLAYEWRQWCSLDVVLDPEHLFGNAGYMMSVVLGDEEQDSARWRLLVLEDCDELIRAEAKSGSGQALARLLNLTDGIIGQGMRVLVAITTNEPLARLHPAIVRAGRCLAEVEVGLLSRAECRRWLGQAVPVPEGGFSLAELWALSAQLAVVRSSKSRDVAVGQYL